MKTLSMVLLLGGTIQDKAIQWKQNYDEALKAAKEAQKNLVVHFSTEW